MLRFACCAACAGVLVSLPIIASEASAQQGPVLLPELVIKSEPDPPKKQKAPTGKPGPATKARAEVGAAQVVVTPSRSAEPVANVASAITVIDRAEIERAGGSGATVAHVLKGLPGLSVAQSGGPGGTTDVRIRGADSDQTLVMIDGVRINDPASTGSEFDFSVLSLANVERIEILRGPQSGLYGSDAIGGVINILTRKGEGPPLFFAEIEGGSYDTFSQRAGVSGASGPVSYSFGASNFRTSGFSRFDGGRENDATEKQAFNGRVDYQIAPNFSIGARLGLYTLDAELDSTQRDTPEYTERLLIDGAVTSRLDLFDGAMRNTLTLYANQADRLFFGCDNAACTSNTTSRFKGQRVGIELQSDFDIRGDDRITVGGRLEQLAAESNDVSRGATGGLPHERYDVTEINKSAFAIYTFNPIRAFTVSAAGRVDDFDTGELIGTYRFAAAYRFDETGTKLRASYGTGAKAPTIQQRFDNTTLFGILPVRGNPDLEIEKSRGFDIGVDQSLFGSAMDVSVTYFNNNIEDLIEYDSATETFVNIDAAKTQGMEVAAELRPLDWLRLRGSYTYLDAIDANTGRQLRRRPEHVAKGTVAIEPFSGAQIAATVVYQSRHFNLDFENPGRDRQVVDGFTRLDLTGNLEINSNATLFLRAENLTDTDYQEVYSFGTAGRSAYAGLRLTF